MDRLDLEQRHTANNQLRQELAKYEYQGKYVAINSQSKIITVGNNEKEVLQKLAGAEYEYIFPVIQYLPYV